jgi:hypothetical protein
MDSELALGVALAPTALGLALVRGQGADVVVLDRDLIQTTTAADTAKGAVLRTYSTAVKHGYRIRAVDVTHTCVDAAAAVQLVNALRQVGVRNVVVTGPTGAASVAAGHALDMVRVPTESPRVEGGRHRGTATSNTPRRVAIGAAATGVLTVLAATVVVHATSTGPAPPAPPPEPSAVPVASSTVSPPTRTTPRSVFTGQSRESRSPTTVSVTPITAVPPSPEPAAPVVTESSATSAVPETPAVSEPPPPADTPAAQPPSDGSAHLPASEDGPRPPGPA